MRRPIDLQIITTSSMMRRKVHSSGSIGSAGSVGSTSCTCKSEPGASISRMYRSSIPSSLKERQRTSIVVALIVALIVFLVRCFLVSEGTPTSLRGGMKKNDAHRCSILETSSPKILSTLQEIDLSGCDISSISSNIKHCTHLRKLDVSFNAQLSTFPDELESCKQLEILFSSSNPGIRSLPPVLGRMPSLNRLGWRSGSLTSLDANSMPPNLVHLILTDNQITHLNDDNVFDRMDKVRKLMLSHNQISSLSATGVTKMRNLELLRLAGNDLSVIPETLWTLPKLTWLTISGNPRLALPKLERQVPTVSLSEMPLVSGDSYLGAGASGSVTARRYEGRDVAVKVIHGVTSDGTAESELEIYAGVGSDGMKNRVVGCVATFDDAEDGKSGVVMEKIPDGMEDFALPPTIIEVTEDRWEGNKNRVYNDDFVLNALRDAADALSYLHGTVGVAHGDFYAHNIKVDNDSGRLYLLDFGASYVKGQYAQQAELLEVRAYGVLINELIKQRREQTIEEGRTDAKLTKLASSCLNEKVKERPTFQDIVTTLSNLHGA